MSGEFLDLSSDAEPQPDSRAGEGARPFIGVRFACCDVYTRIYVNSERSAYVGNCPRCSRRIQMKIGPGGTDSRFFTAY